MPSLIRFFFGVSAALAVASSANEAAPHAAAVKKFLRVNFIIAGVRGLLPERSSFDQQKRLAIMPSAEPCRSTHFRRLLLVPSVKIAGLLFRRLSRNVPQLDQGRNRESRSCDNCFKTVGRFLSDPIRQNCGMNDPRRSIGIASLSGVLKPLTPLPPVAILTRHNHAA